MASGAFTIPRMAPEMPSTLPAMTSCATARRPIESPPRMEGAYAGTLAEILETAAESGTVAIAEQTTIDGGEGEDDDE